MNYMEVLRMKRKTGKYLLSLLQAPAMTAWPPQGMGMAAPAEPDCALFSACDETEYNVRGG